MKKNLLIISALILLSLFLLFTETGFLQLSQIDKKDQQIWNYKDNEIVGTGEFTLRGSTDYCWILIHSYTSTPLEMADLANHINSELNDTVYTILLSGHGQTPSRLLDKSLDVWYNELTNKFDLISNECTNINIAGSSFGATLALKLSQDKQLHNLYLINPFLFTKYRTIIKLTTNILNFDKKLKVANINDPEGLERHVAYVNMPLLPIKNSFEFIDNTIDNLPNIDEPTLISHSKNDKTSMPKSAQLIYDEISSEDKKLKWFTLSNHVLLMDYDKEEVIDEIINFEIEHR